VAKQNGRLVIGLAYRGRAYVLRPRPLVALGATAGLLLVGLWYGCATAYLVYRDFSTDEGARREAELTAQYEDRIASLSASVQRLQSRNLLTQNTLDSKVDVIMAKQAEIERRHEAVNRMLGVRPAAPAAAPGAPKPRAALEAAQLLRTSLTADGQLDQSAKMEAIPKILVALGRIEREQAEAVQKLDVKTRRMAARLRETLAGLGLGPAAIGSPVAMGYAAAGSSAGGPFVPLDPRKAQSFEARLQGLQEAVRTLEMLRDRGRRLPFLRPIQAASEVTSGFGPRVDPFLRRPAMHTGIDFRTEHGQPVAATAAGTVLAAEYSGGYGQMVEIDHGDNVVTRYAHLSSISVRAGQSVKAGTVVGLAGSTGRSTGNHLHYETRVDGEAVDPSRFLDAGARIAPLLR